MGMKLSPEHLAKLQAGRAAAKARKELTGTQVAPPIVEPQTPTDVERLEAMVQALIQEVNTLKTEKNPEFTAEQALNQTAKMQGVNFGPNGVQGIQYKYPVEKSYYPDPTEQLYDEPRLSRYNLRENYFFNWDVEGVNYEKHNINYAEPRFTVMLFRKLYNDDNTFSNKAVLVSRHIQHEDELVSRMAADKLGLEIGPGKDFETFEDMMHASRVVRIREWLLDLFIPAKINSFKRKKVDMVIDGKVVEVHDTEEITTEETNESAASTIQQQVRY